MFIFKKLNEYNSFMENENQKIFHIVPKEITSKFFDKKSQFILYDIKNEKIVNDHISIKNVFSINLKSDERDNLRGGDKNFDKHFNNFLSIEGSKIYVKEESWDHIFNWKLLQDLENFLFKYISNPFRNEKDIKIKNYSFAKLVSFSDDELNNLKNEKTIIINNNLSIKIADKINNYAITLEEKYKEYFNLNLLQIFFIFYTSVQSYKKYLNKEIDLTKFHIYLYPYIFLNKDNFLKSVREEIKVAFIKMNVDKIFDDFEKLQDFNFLTKVCLYHSTEKNDNFLRIYHLDLLEIFSFENLNIVRNLFNPLGDELYIFYNSKKISKEEAYNELKKYFPIINEEYKSFADTYQLTKDLYFCNKHNNNYVYIEKEKFEKRGFENIKELFKIKTPNNFI